MRSKIANEKTTAFVLGLAYVGLNALLYTATETILNNTLPKPKTHVDREMEKRNANIPFTR